MTRPFKMRAKKVHKAAKVNEAGGVSALCFDRPRAIDLTRASWTFVDKFVNCSACLKLMAAKDETAGAVQGR